MTLRQLGIAGLLAAVGWMASVEVASAGTCSFRSTTGEVTVQASEGTELRVRQLDAEQIGISEFRVVGNLPSEGFLHCADVDGTSATPTVANTNSIAVSGGMLSLQPLGPGRTLEGDRGSSEIEVTFDGSYATVLAGAATAGADAVSERPGVNLNPATEAQAQADADLILTGASPRLTMTGTAGDDVLDAGGSGLGGPFPVPVTANGDVGADRLVAGAGPGTLDGGAGDDALTGGQADDVLHPGPGNDAIDGGGGIDLLEFGATTPAPGPLRVDLRLTGPQATGEGTDTITGVENLRGDDYGDTLIGDEGPNALYGGDGEDEILGQGGYDELQGEAFDDRIVGGDGQDTLFGGSEADRLLARDGERDTRIACGGGRADVAKVDRSDPAPRSC